jgi:hypothetical protein
VARPLRFRRATGRWTEGRVRSELYQALDANLGAASRSPWFRPPDGYAGHRFEMDDGSIALFARAVDGDGAYWIGNTETPSALWRTDKFGFDEVPRPIADWTERELLAQLHEESPWLADYPRLSWFYLPVFLSKDGRETTRAFFHDHAAGFPDADRDEALAFYESFLATGVLDDYREVTAGKLGTSKRMDLTRMAAAMGELDAAWLLAEAGYAVTPEIEVSTGHSLDFRAERDDDAWLVEVTRPLPPSRRSAGSPARAIRETVETKSQGQLSAHGGGAVLLVDCSSFPDDDWRRVRGERPDVAHRPAVVFRVRPDGRVEGYEKGRVPLALPV